MQYSERPHPSSYLSNRHVFSGDCVDYALTLPYGLGTAFCDVWFYSPVQPDRLVHARRLIDRCIESGNVAGCEETAVLLERDLAGEAVSWDQKVLVLLARGGVENLFCVQDILIEQEKVPSAAL